MPKSYRITKKILLPIFAVIIAAITIIIGIIILSNTNFAQSAVRSFINAMIPGSISWETLSISPCTGRVQISNAALLDADKMILVSFKKLDVSISVPDLLRGTLLIRSAALDGPAADLAMDGTGSLNLLEALGIIPGKKDNPDKKTSLPKFLIVERFILTNGMLRWSQPASGITAGIDDLNLSVGLNLENRSGDLSLKTGKGYFSRGGHISHITNVSAAGLMKAGSISPCRIDVRTAGSWLAIGGALEDVFAALRFDVTSRFNVSLSELSGILPAPGSMTGTLGGGIRVRGSPGNPSASLNCAYGGGEILGNRVDGVYLDAGIDDRVAVIPALLVRAAGGTCSLSGSIGLREAFPEGFLSGNRNPDLASYRADVVIASFPLNAIPLPGGAMHGAINANVSVRGTGFSPAAAFAAIRVAAGIDNFSRHEGNQPAPLSLAMEGKLERGLVSIESLSATLGNMQISGTGSLNPASGAVSASISGSSVDLSREAAAFGRNAGGSCTFDAALYGTMRHPALSLRILGEGLRYEETTLGNATLEASLDADGAAHLSRFSLVNGSSTVSLSGSTRLDLSGSRDRAGDRPLSLDIHAFNVQLGDFNNSVKGLLTIAGSISGSVMHPAGGLSLSATAVDLGFQKLDAASIKTGMRGGRIYLDHFTFDVAPGETVRIGGWITPAGAYKLTLSADNLSLGSNPYIKSTGMDGKLSMSLDGEGSLSDPRAKGPITLRDVRFRDRQYEDFRVDLSIADRVIRAKGRLNFDLAGYYDLIKKNFNISLVFDKTDLSPFLSASGNPGLSASLSGSINAKGNADRPLGLDLSVNLLDCDVSSGTRMLLSTGPLKATIRGGMLSVPQTRIAILDSGWIRFSGTGPIRSAVAIDSDGLIPVELASWFSGSLANASGFIRFTTRLRGDLYHPVLNAGITLQDIGFDVPSISNGLRGISGSIDVMPGSITIPGIRGSLGNGTIGMNGRIGLKGLAMRDIMLNMSADHAGISVPDTLDLDFNARLNVAGTFARIMVRGDVTILRGLYYQDLVLHPFRNIGERKTEKIDTGGGKSPLEKIKFDIALKNRSPFEIDNNIARMTINNNLRFFGSAARPVLNGSLRVESGSIFYLGREFVINSGKVDFLNPYRIDPLIDIQGSSSIQGWNVLIGLSGKLDALAFTLSSQPVLDSGDILSLILIGKTKGKKSSLSAAQLISQAITLTYGGAIKKKTGIDSIEIKAEDEGKRSSSGNFSATIGKNLNDRVTYYYTVGKDNRGLRSSTTIEYKFFDNFLIDAEYDSNGKTGASIRYTRSFR